MFNNHFVMKLFITTRKDDRHVKAAPWCSLGNVQGVVSEIAVVIAMRLKKRVGFRVAQDIRRDVRQWRL